MPHNRLTSCLNIWAQNPSKSSGQVQHLQTLCWYLRQNSVSRGCTPNPLTGAAFVDTPLVLCANTVFHVGVRQIRWHVQHLQTLPWYLCQGSVSHKCVPNRLTGVASADTWGFANTVFHVGVRQIRWRRRSVGRFAKAVFSHERAPNPLTSAAFADTPMVLGSEHCFTWVYAKSADKCSICRHSVGTCAGAVFHVGVRQIRWQVQHLQTLHGHLRQSSVSTWVYAKSADACSICRHLVLAPTQCYVSVCQICWHVQHVQTPRWYLRQDSVSGKCAPNPLTPAIFVGSLLVLWPVFHVGVRQIRWKVQHLNTVRWSLRRDSVSRWCTRSPVTGAAIADAPRHLNQDSSSRGCTPNPLTGAAFADSPLVLAPKQCFKWVHAKSADRRGISRHSVDICARTVFHVSARQIRWQVQHLRTLRWCLRQDNVSRGCTPNPLTRAAFADTPFLLLRMRCHVGARQILWTRPAFPDTLLALALRRISRRFAPNPLTSAAFASSPLYAKSADRCIICGRFVGACAKTVFHVGVRQIRLQVEHLQTVRWYLRRDSVSRGCTPNLLTGVVCANTPLVLAPRQCVTLVYAKCADRCSVSRECTPNPLTGAAFVNIPLVPGAKQCSSWVGVHPICWHVQHLQTLRWYLRQESVFRRFTPNPLTGAAFADTPLVRAPRQCFTWAVRHIRWQVRHLQTLHWYFRQWNVSRECMPNPLTRAAFADTPLVLAPRHCYVSVCQICWQAQHLQLLRWHLRQGSVSHECTRNPLTGAAFAEATLALPPRQCFTMMIMMHTESADRCSICRDNGGTCANTVSVSRNCTPNPLTGAAFADTPFVLAPRQCFTWVYAKSVDRCSICRHFVRVCAETVFHVSVRQIRWQLQQLQILQTLHWYVRQGSVFTWVYAKSADRCSICRRSVGVCAKTVFQLSARQTRWHLQHLQPLRWYVCRNGVSRGCPPNPLTGAAFADAPLALAPRQCFTWVYTKSADRWSFWHSVGTCAKAMFHVDVRQIRWQVQHLQTLRWYLREDNVWPKYTPNPLTGGANAVFHVRAACTPNLLKVLHLQTIPWCARKSNVWQGCAGNLLKGALLARQNFKCFMLVYAQSAGRCGICRRSVGTCAKQCFTWVYAKCVDRCSICRCPLARA